MIPAHYTRQDWSAIIEHLESRKVKHIDIAAHVDRSEGWVGMLKRRIIKQPPHEQGELLLQLAAEHGYVPRDTQYPQVDGEKSA